MTLFQLPTVADDDDDDDEEEAEEDDDDDDEDARDDDDEEEEELDDDDEPPDDIAILNVPVCVPSVHCPDMLQPPPPKSDFWLGDGANRHALTGCTCRH